MSNIRTMAVLGLAAGFALPVFIAVIVCIVLLILHKNIPNSLGQFTSAVAKENTNISDMVNRSKGEYACTMLDLDSPVSEKVIDEIKGVKGVLRVRVIA